MKSTRFKDSDKPDLQFALGYPSETDKLRLRSGTVLQREVTERERRRLEREQKREKELASKAKRVTYSSEAIDTDEANRHMQSILSRVSQQPQLDELTPRMVEITSIRPPEDSAEEPLEGSDMDTTVVDKEGSLVKSLGAVKRDGELKTLSDYGSGNLQRSVVRTLRYGTPPPTLGIGPTNTKLMFGLSRSLENMNSTVTDDMLTNRSGLGLGYIN